MITELKANKSVNSSDVIFVEGHTPNYGELYKTTRFCLAPHGADVALCVFWVCSLAGVTGRPARRDHATPHA